MRHILHFLLLIFSFSLLNLHLSVKLIISVKDENCLNVFKSKESLFSSQSNGNIEYLENLNLIIIDCNEESFRGIINSDNDLKECVNAIETDQPVYLCDDVNKNVSI